MPRSSTPAINCVAFLSVLVPLCSIPGVFATGNNINDWVNPSYVLNKDVDQSATAAAQKALTDLASGTAKKGPWSVMNGTLALPPSGDPRDYFSWAPYHWPNCNWCPSAGRTHLANASSNATQPNYDPLYNASEYPSNYCTDPDDEYCEHPGEVTSGNHSYTTSNSRIRRIHNYDFSARQDPDADPPPNSQAPDLTTLTPTSVLPIRTGAPDDSTTMDQHSVGPAQAAAHTTAKKANTTKKATATKKAALGKKATTTRKATSKKVTTKKATATKTVAKNAQCTPSPTKPIAPSATWTACPYITLDGKVNPDVRELNGVNAITAATESIVWNALAYVFKGSSSFSKAAVTMIDVFFLDSSSAMHPNMNYGQVIRGPQKQVGQFTGVLDLRGMVKVVNAIEILRATRSPDWTAPKDAQFVAWTTQYVNWLETSAVGKKTAVAANNHASFYYNQLVSAKILINDTSGAAASLQTFFSDQFQDQVAASGEQPFEAVRTRPFHYRCFNLEALITLAKLGDQLGLDLWTYKSRYGANIQNIVDYTMGVNPKTEDGTEVYPHVAAAAAAYGDPTGKYSAWLQKKAGNSYTTAAWWYYDQPDAFLHSPAATGQTVPSSTRSYPRRSLASLSFSEPANGTASNVTSLTNSTVSPGDGSVNSTAVTGDIASFVCPAVFHTAPTTQLDDGTFVTCDDIKPFYVHAADVDTDE